MIRLDCPGCDKKLNVRDELAGRTVRCPQCKTTFRAPEPEPPDEGLPEERSTARPSRKPQPQPRPQRRPIEEDEDREAITERPLPRGKRRPAGEDEDGDREAARRGRRRGDDEEDFEDDEPRRRPAPKRKKKRRGGDAAGLISGIEPFYWGLIGVGVFWLLTLIPTFVWPAFSMVPLVLGWLLAVAGGIWFLMVAFQDSALAGVLCLLVPFYSLYYLITHFEETKRPFFVQLLGCLLVMTASCAGGFSATRDARVPGGLRGEVPSPFRTRAAVQKPAAAAELWRGLPDWRMG
jgi:hypothetical protein